MIERAAGGIRFAPAAVRLLLEREIFGMLKYALREGLSLKGAADLRPWNGSSTESAASGAAERITDRKRGV